MNHIKRLYRLVLIKYPISTQAAQTGVLMGTGDVLSQTYIEEKTLENINWQRTGKFAAVGLCYIGPVLRIWYGLLSKHIKGQNKLFVTVKKVCCDQLLFSPVFLFSALFVIGIFAQGREFQNNVSTVSEMYPEVLTNAYKLWPAVQLVNLYFIRLEFQVLVVQAVSLFWNTYISWKTNLDNEIEQK